MNCHCSYGETTLFETRDLIAIRSNELHEEESGLGLVSQRALHQRGVL